MMSKRLTISFKETSKDMQLYSYIMSMDDKSAEIKRALREQFMKGKKNV